MEIYPLLMNCLCAFVILIKRENSAGKTKLLVDNFFLTKQNYSIKIKKISNNFK